MKWKVKELTIIGMGSALAYVLMLFETPPILGFLRFDLSDLPAVLLTFIYGPIAGIIVELIKNLIKGMTSSFTSGVGEFANFLVAIAYIIPLGIMYKKYCGKHKEIISFITATISMTVAGIIINFYLVIPLFAKIMGGEEAIVAMSNVSFPFIDSIWKLVIFGISPFNLVKGIFVMAIPGYLVYKKLGIRVKKYV